MLLNIDTEAEGDTLNVTLSGDFDMGSVADFRSEIEEKAEPWTRAMIDMHDVVFMDSSGLQELLRLNNRAREQGHEVVLVRISVPVRRLLALTGLESHFTIGD
jgi:anti-sigma B factor antagonist